MTLPRINITLSNGNLNQTTQGADGIAGLVLSGEAVVGKVQLHTPYLITSLEAAVTLGIDSVGVNAYAYKQIAQFFLLAGAGAQLYILLTDATVDQAADTSGSDAPELLRYAAGKIRVLGISVEKPGSPTIAQGLVQEVHTAVPLAQALAEEFAAKYQPLRVVIDGTAYDGTVGNLKDYKTTDNNRVAILIGAADDAENAAVGALIGRLAAIPVQRKISRVADGAVEGITEAYLTDGSTVEAVESDWEAIHAKGYIFFRTHASRDGYYFTSDVTCTADTDDYNSLARGRVIDKAIVLAYDVMLQYLNDEIAVAEDGTISLALAKNWQGQLEERIGRAMVAQGEASDVQAVVDPAQDVLSSNQITVTLRILPVGYSDTINVELGFTTQTA
ncbi:MAG: DUF2586 family protein [Flavobacteriales bacterium]|nr:DUF2586 family protein [Flavobacteriales bacterium]